MSLSDRIRAARKSAGLSQEELARRAGTSLNGVRNLEQGARIDPHYSTLSKLAKALNMSVAELMGEPALAGKAEAPLGSTSPETGAGGASGRDDESVGDGELYREALRGLVVAWEEDLARWEDVFSQDSRPKAFDYGKLLAWTHTVIRALLHNRHAARQDIEMGDTLRRMEDLDHAARRLLERVHGSKIDAEYWEVLAASGIEAVEQAPGS